MDKQEFKTLVLPSKGKLFRIALSLLSSREEAEDTLQDVFLKLWHMREKLPQYNSVEALQACSFQIFPINNGIWSTNTELKWTSGISPSEGCLSIGSLNWYIKF